MGASTLLFHSRPHDHMKNIHSTLDIDAAISKMQLIPANYAYCVQTGCPRSHNCLRSTLLHESGDKHYIRIINPTNQHIAPECSDYRPSDTKATYALGFSRRISRMNLDEKSRFQNRCMLYFCKTVFYEMRSGKRIISPKEQQLIIQAAEEENIIFAPTDFDHTFEAPEW